MRINHSRNFKENINKFYTSKTSTFTVKNYFILKKVLLKFVQFKKIKTFFVNVQPCIFNNYILVLNLQITLKNTKRHIKLGKPLGDLKYNFNKKCLDKKKI